MWLEFVYSPSTLFSLKDSNSSSSGAKSLVSPSPYAVKMALLNEIISHSSVEEAKKTFTIIRDLKIMFALPKNIIINNGFFKVRRLNDKAKNEELATEPYKSTVTFREYIFLGGDIKIAIQTEKKNFTFVSDWMRKINYFGKRGCFFQYKANNEIEKLSSDYAILLTDEVKPGLIFEMDDVDLKAKFENMDSYAKANAKRIKRLYIFPYNKIGSSRGYTQLERLS